jgi:hypothetical protein
MWFGVYTNMTSNSEPIFTLYSQQPIFSTILLSRSMILSKITHGEIENLHGFQRTDDAMRTWTWHERATTRTAKTRTRAVPQNVGRRDGGRYRKQG